MPGSRPVTIPADLIYLYDGSLRGLYCCIHESVYSRQMPMDIQPAHKAEPTLLPCRAVETDAEKAARVRAAIAGKGSPRALELVETVFMSCLAQKELKTLRFLLLLFAEGPKALSMLHHPDVSPMIGAERHLMGEQHLLRGFIRFSDHGGNLIATISPKNFVLPFLADHFITRLSCETFMIYDRTHRAALIHEKGKSQIVEMESLYELELSDKELLYQALWKQFYETLSIEARYNPKCRMTHMPKRYWADMTEMKDLLTTP